jgi:competence CoiA-like predicted nuclease
MQFDINRNKPTPKSVSTCPACKGPIKAKCGKIKIWHWAHQSLEGCDANWNPISQWHLDWQALVPEEYTEVIIGHHIADIKLPNGKVIEIQNSNLPVEVVEEREKFYGDMLWIFNGKDFEDKFILTEKFDESTKELIYHSFKFKRARQYIVRCTKQVYIDFGTQVFKIRKLQSKQYWSDDYGKYYTVYSGWGNLREKDSRLFRELFGEFYKPTPKPDDGGTTQEIRI